MKSTMETDLAFRTGGHADHRHPTSAFSPRSLRPLRFFLIRIVAALAALGQLGSSAFWQHVLHADEGFFVIPLLTCYNAEQIMILKKLCA